MFQTLKKSVLEKQKVLAELYSRSGHLSLREYAGTWRVATGRIGGRLLDIVKNFTEEIYGSVVAQGVISQLTQTALVSTIDHHGILNHPFFVNSNLIYSLRKDLKYLTVLTTAGVSLNNSSWPAALSWGINGKAKRLSFFSDRSKTLTVLGAPALTVNNFDKLLNQIKREPLITEEGQRLMTLISELQSAKTLFNFKKFYQQASILSTILWSKVFPSAPPVIYLPLEVLSARYLLAVVNTEPNSVLFKLFYTSEGWALLNRYFDGSLGAFCGHHKGSFLFWGINEKGKRVCLTLNGGMLEGENFHIELDPLAVGQALVKQQLYPTTLVSFLILLVENLAPLGGFNQVNWLTDIKVKFTALLGEMGELALAAQVSTLPSDNFAEGNLAFIFKNNQLIKPGGLDIYLLKEEGLFDKYHELAAALTLGESIETLLPEIYRVVIPAEDRRRDLLLVTDEEIAQSSGMAGKIKQILS